MITTLHGPTVEVHDGRLRLEVQVDPAPGTVAGAAVFLEVEPGSDAVADASVIPMVPAALVLACRLSQDLRVEEPLPPSLHEGPRHVARLLHEWYGWRPAELIAPLGPDRVRPAWAHLPRGRAVFFTRGVDSWGALLDRMEGPARQRPTHLITLDNEVHLPVDIREGQLRDTRAAAERIGLQHIVVRTDVRSLLDQHTDWGTATHGSVLAGTGLLLRSTLQEVVIAPTHWTPLLRPWGSHPELDPAWSLPDLTVTHHSGHEARWERVARITADPVAADTLMVCWQGTGTRNCGRCEKCLRLLTSLHLLGRLDATADRFDVPFDPAAVGPHLVVSPHPWCDTMDHLDRIGLSADPLRQRWEAVQVSGRPTMWFQTRPIQPRIPLAVDGDDAERADAVTAIGRRLAPLGLRVDHLADAGAGAGAEPDLGPALHVGRAPAGGWAVAIDPADDPIPLAELRADHLAPLLAALGLDPTDAVPFRPDGQEPPPVVPEPPGWREAAADEAAHR